MLRDGMHQMGVHTGVAPYRPNSLDKGLPEVTTAEEGAYVPTPRQVNGPVVRAQPASFDDHFTQPAMFYRSLSEIEKQHLIEAFTFELGKCYEQAVKERQLEVLANVDAELCRQVAAGLGLPAPNGAPPTEVPLSPALSQVVTEPGPIMGRQIGIIADAGCDLAEVSQLVKAITKLGAVPLVTAPVGGTLKSGRRSVIVERTFLTARSVEFDAVVVAGGMSSAPDLGIVLLLQQAYRHCKALAAWGSGLELLTAAGITKDDPGVLVAKEPDRGFVDALTKAVGLHRVWERTEQVLASTAPRCALRPPLPRNAANADAVRFGRRQDGHPSRMNASEIAALPFRAGAALRHARVFHPDGLLCAGTLRRVADVGAGLPVADGEVLGRFSKGVGTPSACPISPAWRGGRSRRTPRARGTC